MPDPSFDPLTEAKRRYGLYVAAEQAILAGQSYSIGGRSLVRANLAEVRKEMDVLLDQIQTLSRPGGGGIKLSGAVPL